VTLLLRTRTLNLFLYTLCTT
jgi:hypothetical protein